ncbi:MAG: HD domain-containing phosphohydrolase [Bdellovibrionota bacterium]
MEEKKRKTRAILVVDSDPAFLETIKADPKNQRCQSITASTLKEAQLLLAAKEHQFIALFLNPVLPNTFDPGIIRHAHHYRPATPIFILFDKPPPFTDSELKGMGVQDLVKKPVGYAKLIETADPPRFEEADAMALSSDEKVGQEVTGDDEGFKAISAGDFISGSRCMFDIYVQLGSGRYIMLLKAGDEFDRERLFAYIKKGVKYFYIRRAAQESYLNYCDQMAKVLMKSDKIPVATITSQVLNFGQEVMDFLKDSGISETNLEYASHHIKHIHNVVAKIGGKKGDALKAFLKDLDALEHGNATCFIASMVMKQLKFSDPDVVEAVGLACLFHDFGLHGMPENVKSEDITKMSEAELEIFYTHPTIGAKKLRGIPSLTEAVLQAVEQHHERRTRKGFPGQLGAGAINGIAEIVGISDEFVNLMKRAKLDNTIKPIQELESKVFDGFSSNVVEAFRVGLGLK